MYCPECEGEFREGIRTCPDCEVELVEELVEPPHDPRALESVFETPDPALLPVARSLLEGADIRFLVKGEEMLGLFPGAAGGLAVDPEARAAQILVAPDVAEEARALLAELEEGAGDRLDAEPDTDD